MKLSKKVWLIWFMISMTFLLAWCHQEIEVIDDCIISEKCTDISTNESSEIPEYFSAFWTEPYRDLEISGGIAKLTSQMYDTNYAEPINIRKEWENFYFTWEELDWHFILKDCVDWGKWDLHYYTVEVAKFRDYVYEWCWDNGEIKMSDEEYEASIWA